MIGIRKVLFLFIFFVGMIDIICKDFHKWKFNNNKLEFNFHSDLGCQGKQPVSQNIISYKSNNTLTSTLFLLSLLMLQLGSRIFYFIYFFALLTTYTGSRVQSKKARHEIEQRVINKFNRTCLIRSCPWLSSQQTKYLFLTRQIAITSESQHFIAPKNHPN